MDEYCAGMLSTSLRVAAWASAGTVTPSALATARHSSTTSCITSRIPTKGTLYPQGWRASKEIAL